MVIYSMAAGGSVSVAALFLAGLLPGLLLGAMLAVYCLYVARKKNFPKGDVIPLRQAIKICTDAMWGLMTMVIILGGIMSGVFTANESASIAVIFSCGNCEKGVIVIPGDMVMYVIHSSLTTMRQSQAVV